MLFMILDYKATHPSKPPKRSTVEADRKHPQSNSLRDFHPEKRGSKHSKALGQRFKGVVRTLFAKQLTLPHSARYGWQMN